MRKILLVLLAVVLGLVLLAGVLLVLSVAVASGGLGIHVAFWGAVIVLLMGGAGVGLFACVRVLRRPARPGRHS